MSGRQGEIDTHALIAYAIPEQRQHNASLTVCEIAERTTDDPVTAARDVLAALGLLEVETARLGRGGLGRLGRPRWKDPRTGRTRKPRTT